MGCMDYDPKGVGEKSEAIILAALLRSGRVVLKPFGDNQRYDLVVDEGQGKFLRIQCKTGRLKKGALIFDTCSSYVHRGRGKRTYRGEAELFGVYSPDLDRVFLVPVEITGSRSCALRIIPSANKQSKNVRLADAYELVFLGSQAVR